MIYIGNYLQTYCKNEILLFSLKNRVNIEDRTTYLKLRLLNILKLYGLLSNLRLFIFFETQGPILLGAA